MNPDTRSPSADNKESRFREAPVLRLIEKLEQVEAENANLKNEVFQLSHEVDRLLHENAELDAWRERALDVVREADRTWAKPSSTPKMLRDLLEDDGC